MPTSFSMDSIKNYLIYSSDKTYDNQSVRAYKSLRAYSHMEGGHVRMMMNINKCAESTIFMFVRGYCLPSQSTTHVYPVHVCLDKHSGVEYGAACRCVAGLGECCTHVAAVLFKLDDLMTRGLKAIPEDLARTEKSCAWIAPANLASVKAVPLDEVLTYKPVVDKVKPEKPAIGLEMFHPVPLHLLKPAPGRAGELAAKLRQTSPTCTFAWSFDVQQYAQPPAEPLATPASLVPRWVTMTWRTHGTLQSLHLSQQLQHMSLHRMLVCVVHCSSEPCTQITLALCQPEKAVHDQL